MAGQKGSFQTEDSTVLSPDLGFNSDSIMRIKQLAKDRGISVSKFISDILLQHLASFDSQLLDNPIKKDVEEKKQHPLRFIDPADQISIDEDFRDLI